MSRDPFGEVFGNGRDASPPRKWSSWGTAPETPDYLDGIPTADWKPKKRKDTRKRRPVFFVRNLYDLKEPLRRAAGELGIPRDMLVRYLLERGLEAHRTGVQRLTPVLDQQLTLYPQETLPRKRRGRKNPNAKGVGFRGVPEGVAAEIREVAQSLSVPVWQVVRRFLEQGLADYRQGTLEIPVVTVSTQKYTLYPQDDEQ